MVGCQNKFDSVDPLAMQVFHFANKSQLCANRAPKVPPLTPHDSQPNQPTEGFLQAGALQKKTDNDSVTKGQSPAKNVLKHPMYFFVHLIVQERGLPDS